MVNTGATSGQVFYGKPGILSNNLFKISFDTHFAQKYLYIFLSSPVFRDKVFGGVKGGANPHLGHKSFGRQIVSIPPLAEQHRIVAKVDELMTLCDALKASLATAQATQLNLADSLVEQAVT